MNFITFTKLLRTLLLVTALAVGTVGLAGCAGTMNSGAVQTATFTDSRDGKAYKTVTIGKQTWLAENMNIETGNSWCYDDTAKGCEYFGRLYDWNTAKVACPEGWHLPSNDEWNELIGVAGSSIAGWKLKAKKGWIYSKNGRDNYGFSASPGGVRYPEYLSEHRYLAIGRNGFWWTSSEDGSGNAYYRGMDEDRYVKEFHHDDGKGGDTKGFGLSVRCVAGE